MLRFKPTLPPYVLPPGFVLSLALLLLLRPIQAQTTASVEIDFVEDATGQPLTCRVQILDSQGRPQRARGTLYQGGWNLVESPLLFRGRPGEYSYRAFHGPEFSPGSGGFTFDKNSHGQDILRLQRHANLSDEHWIAGDLMSHVAAEKTQPWLAAEELGLAVVVRSNFSHAENAPQEFNDAGSRWVEDYSYHDDRPGSGLTLHHWLPPAEVPLSLPSSRLLMLAKADKNPTEAGSLPVHAEIQRLWARDVPIWLASGQIDSIQILSDHLSIDGTGSAKFEPILDPDPGRFRGDRGPGRLVEYLYWQVLECGLRIPPSAGSGFGKSPSPLGYNRVYALIGSRTPGTWWQALRAGNTFVTSGPLLRASVNGEPPGKVFSASQGASIDLNISLTLTVADPVEYLDVIHNGKTLYQARLDEYAKQGGIIPTQSIRESGWLVIRVVTERDQTYRIATTAPYYFEFGEQPRISRAAVKFFSDWLERSAELITAQDQATTTAAQPYLQAARDFWRRQLEQANVD